MVGGAHPTNKRALARGEGTGYYALRFTLDAQRTYFAGLSPIERRLMGLH